MEVIRGLAGSTACRDRKQVREAGSPEPCGRRLPPSLEASEGPGKPQGREAAVCVWRHQARLFNQAQGLEDKEARGRNPREERGASCYWLLVPSVSVSAPHVHFPFQRFWDHPKGSCRQCPHNPIQYLPPLGRLLCVPQICLISRAEESNEHAIFQRIPFSTSTKPLLGLAHARF